MGSPTQDVDKPRDMITPDAISTIERHNIWTQDAVGWLLLRGAIQQCAPDTYSSLCEDLSCAHVLSLHPCGRSFAVDYDYALSPSEYLIKLSVEFGRWLI